MRSLLVCAAQQILNVVELVLWTRSREGQGCLSSTGCLTQHRTGASCLTTADGNPSLDLLGRAEAGQLWAALGSVWRGINREKSDVTPQRRLGREGEETAWRILQGESKEERNSVSEHAFSHGTVDLNICQCVRVCTLYSVFYQEYDNL